MTQQTTGIHHVTAVASDPQANVDFYVGVLGLRLVKQTVNFDAPDTYHLYYGDGAGSPGTILTFFPWAGAARGRQGTGQATVTSFAIPANAVGFWVDRLAQRGVSVAGPTRRFDEEVLAFEDPDGLRLELVARGDSVTVATWEASPIQPEQAIRGFQGVTLTEARLAPTDALLTGRTGFRHVATDGNRSRYQATGPGPGAYVDVLDAPDAPRGYISAGTVHHVAFRAPDDATQLTWQQELTEERLSVSPVMDRQYFHSIYFREPGGVLFEIATDPPGFATDDAPSTLGTSLRLPPWLEPARSQIEAMLPPLRIPTATAAQNR